MSIKLIAAVARGGTIGFRGRLLYRIPEDMAHFRQLTQGHTVIMGRLTYESLPHGPLPHRRNIVLTRQPQLSFSAEPLPVALSSDTSLELCPSLESALSLCSPGEDVFVIGGAQVYRQAIALADELCLTEIEATPNEADAFFPDYSSWRPVKRERFLPTPSCPHAFSFVTYRLPE